jgi:hypothetical protein
MRANTQLALDFNGGYLNYGASLMHHRFRDIEDLIEQSVAMSEQKSKKPLQAFPPPSTLMTAPVMKLAAGLARKATTAAISSGWP